MASTTYKECHGLKTVTRSDQKDEAGKGKRKWTAAISFLVVINFIARVATTNETKKRKITCVRVRE